MRRPRLQATVNHLRNTIDEIHGLPWWRARRVAAAGCAKALVPLHAARRHAARSRGMSPAELLAALEKAPTPIDSSYAQQLVNRLEMSGWCDENSLLERRLTQPERRAIFEADGLLRFIAGLPEDSPSAASPAADRPLVLVDARCFQEPSRWSDLHAEARKTITAARAAAPGHVLALLTSVELPLLDVEIAATADEVVPNAAPVQDRVALFVEPCPVAVSSLPALPLLGSSMCSTAVLELDGIRKVTPRKKPHTAARRLVHRVRSEALHHYDVVGPPLEGVQTDLRATVRRGSRPRVALLSPFPPQRSAAAAYSEFTARALSESVDLEVYTTAASVGADRFPVHRLSTAPYVERRFDAVVTVVENSLLDGPVLDLVTECGGGCIAHDERMVEAYVHDRGAEPTATLLSTNGRPLDHDDIVDVPRGGDRRAAGYGLLARCASPLIVHGSALAQGIEQETGIRPVAVPFAPNKLPPVELIDHDARATARVGLGLAENRTQVVMLNRTLDRDVELVTRALAWLRSWDVPADLHIVCSAPSDPSFLHELARELEVERNVVIHGPSAHEIGHRLLLAADVAVQLRAKSLTLSPPLVACITSGIPTVASTGLVDEEDLPSYVSRVGWNTSPLLVAEAIEGLRNLRNEQGVELEGERRDYIRKRSPETYARALLQALGVDVR